MSYQQSRLMLRRSIVAASATAVTASILILRPAQTPLSNDASANYLEQSQLHGGKSGTISPTAFLWGQDKVTMTNDVKKPKVFIENVVLRDLVIHEKYGAMVDEKGNVCLWGQGYGKGKQPEAVLKGKNIRSVACSDDKIFALSMTGEVFIFPVSKQRQSIGEERRSVGDPWWKLGFGEGDAGTDFEKLKTDVLLEKNEK